MRLNAHNLRFLNEKGTPFEDRTVEPSLLYEIKAISFTTLIESQQVEPSAHTPLHLWKPSQSTVGTRTTRRKLELQEYQIDPKRLWANVPGRIFLSLSLMRM